MAIKQQQHLFKGMQRDLSVSKFNPEFAFDAHNIRITARDNNTLLTVTNERGTKELTILDGDKPVIIEGTILNYTVLNNYVTIFTTDTVDRIIRLEYKANKFEYKELFEGKLNFNKENPIESLSIYENDNIQKVYWIDGLNQTRVINITAPQETVDKWDDTSFDFIQNLSLNEEVTVVRKDISNGSFSSGVIQYAFTYYNQYGQESNIVYVSPLSYISSSDSGSAPDAKVSNSFEITIKNIDTKFDYLRLYSIHRASEDAAPSVNIIANIAMKGNTKNKITYIDNGYTGTAFDITQLLYVGGEEIVFKTMTQKDNTLFLGNAQIKRKIISPELIKLIRDCSVNFEYSAYYSSQNQMTGSYPYSNKLHLGPDIKTFKYLEWYRFGIQLQHKSGKWSEPIWVDDIQNDFKPRMTFKNYYKTYAKFKYNESMLNKAKEEDFIRVRGVVVYPTISDREVVAQGMVCPTVYNVEDRFTNSPFVQASWFSRPNLCVDVESEKDSKTPMSSSTMLPYIGYSTENSPAYLITNNSTPFGHINEYYSMIKYGAWSEFRHNYPLPNNWERNAEIQTLSNVPDSPLVRNNSNPSIARLFVNQYSDNFFVDQSIVTFHSPEIEFDDTLISLDSDDLKFRIIGVINLTGTETYLDIQNKTPPNKVGASGFYNPNIGTVNQSPHGFRGLLSGPFWLDKATNVISGGTSDYEQAFLVYPWHRNGSLNNQGTPEEGKTRTAMLDKKKMSNVRFSTFNTYLEKVWSAYEEGSNTLQGISGVTMFNSTEQSMVRIKAPLNSNLQDINYYGNIDKVVSPVTNWDGASSKYDLTFQTDQGEKTLTLDKKDGYPIVYTGSNLGNSVSELHLKEMPKPLSFSKFQEDKLTSSVNFGTDPVRIKYKSTPHAVMALNYSIAGEQRVLPTLYSSTPYKFPINKATMDTTVISGSTISGSKFFWDPSFSSPDTGSTKYAMVSQDTIDIKSDTGFLYLAELYRDNVENRFGGKTEEAFENNIWLPGGEPVKLDTLLKDPTKSVVYSEGDTFFLRYDCLKTYPYTMEDQNSVTEIVSFLCETRVNLDGRYDRNRGQKNNLTVTPENFNKLNKVYSQKNNYFNYRGVNPNRFSLNYFPNTVTWTKEKHSGSLTDSWTNITMASTLDLDGDKGEVVSLNTLNNEIFCFQRQGLSNILFNSRVQIPTSDGVPIEISNGMKVQGKRYISNTIGCSNKWSIAESPQGLYFVDDITNSIYLFGGQIKSLSDSLGFRQWVGSRSTVDSWTPDEFQNIRTYYDRNNNDVYFTYKDTSLVYSELLGQFTSFMDYGGVPAMFNVGAEYYSINKGKLWHQFNGEYNMFYGEYKPFDITFIANADSPYDKVFNTLEFRADSWDKDTLIKGSPFTQLDVWNEYQRGSLKLIDTPGKPSPLKKKFRVWRANIPRSQENGRDRIRNTWAFIKLSSTTPNTNRTEFHDAITHYFI